MSLALDHIVIAVSDLDQAFADYSALGFTVIRGGEHANGITHNVLVVLADGAYLELIAWKRPEPGNRWSDIYHGVGEGFVDYALLPDDIGAVVSRAQSRGLDIAAPVPGGRNRPDGERLEWQTARSPKPDVPFLCGDVTPRRLRVQEGEVRRHPNGVTGVATLTVAVRDLESSLKRNAALLGATEGATSEELVGAAPARTATLGLANGTAVIIATPVGQDGALARALASRGEGPFAVVFAGGGGEPRELDPALTHGAPLSIA
jgi:catechol 2,3-dioxygenase-like lactoylglutathione lyase family enzyme